MRQPSGAQCGKRPSRHKPEFGARLNELKCTGIERQKELIFAARFPYPGNGFTPGNQAPAGSEAHNPAIQDGIFNLFSFVLLFVQPTADQREA